MTYLTPAFVQLGAGPATPISQANTPCLTCTLPPIDCVLPTLVVDCLAVAVPTATSGAAGVDTPNPSGLAANASFHPAISPAGNSDLCPNGNPYSKIRYDGLIYTNIFRHKLFEFDLYLSWSALSPCDVIREALSGPVGQVFAPFWAYNGTVLNVSNGVGTPDFTAMANGTFSLCIAFKNLGCIQNKAPHMIGVAHAAEGAYDFYGAG
ncbi:MAG: hypothetical protein ACYDGR_15950 [Candidatus Dormibacteria bacterium]